MNGVMKVMHVTVRRGDLRNSSVSWGSDENN